jgi:hypothetical protein
LRDRIWIYHQFNDLRATFRRRLLRWRRFVRRRLSRRRFLWRYFTFNPDVHHCFIRPAWGSYHQLESCGLFQAHFFLTHRRHFFAVQEHRVVLGAAHFPVQHGTAAAGHCFLAGPKLYLWLRAWYR